MAVYVDAMMPTARSRSWSYDESCHLFADTEDELHEMAQRIGMKRAWFQDRRKGDRRFPHYDLVRSRREMAVKLGAVEVNRRRFCELVWPERIAKRGSGDGDISSWQEEDDSRQ